MIPPRRVTRTNDGSALGPHVAMRHRSGPGTTRLRVARFPGWLPRKPDAQWTHFRCAQGQKSDVGDPTCASRARVIRTLSAPCAGPLRPIDSTRLSRAIHRESTICSLPASTSSTTYLDAQEMSVHYFRASRRF